MELVQCKPVCVAHFTVSVLFSEQVFFPHQLSKAIKAFTRRFLTTVYLVLSCKQDHYWLQKVTCTQYTNDKLQNADQETQLYMTHHLVCTILKWELNF